MQRGMKKESENSQLKPEKAKNKKGAKNKYNEK